MEYEMKFCVGCYLPLAMELSSKLLAANSHNEELSIRIQPGKTGSFEIFRDGKLLFSKEVTGKLPDTSDLGLEEMRTEEPRLESGKEGSCC